MKRLPHAQLCAGLFVLILSVAPAHAQDTAARTDPVRDRLGIHFNAVVYGTGDHLNCRMGTGVGGGVELRSTGRWLAAVSADLLLAAPLLCTEAETLALFRGEYVTEESGVMFVPAPRLGARLGRNFRWGQFQLEPSAAAGMLQSRSISSSGNGRQWQPWYGASIDVRPDFLRVGVRFEYGVHAAPVLYQQGQTNVHRFDRWEPLVSFAVLW
ncbi:MAG: hypothetical protein ACRENP_22185 [Longimicrobiales bacterium]